MVQSARKSPRTRFALHDTDVLSPRVYSSPLVSRAIDFDTPGSALTPESSDIEWEMIKNGMAGVKRLEQEMNDGQDDSDIIRAITFATPRKQNMSLDAIAGQRAELEMVKYHNKLEDELEDLDATIQNWEECFKSMFSEITYKRLVIEFQQIHHRKPKPINCYSVVEKLNLAEHAYAHWPTLIEEAIAEALR